MAVGYNRKTMHNDFCKTDTRSVHNICERFAQGFLGGNSVAPDSNLFAVYQHMVNHMIIERSKQ